MSNASKQIANVISDAIKGKTQAYDTTATVQRIEGDTAWVHIPGGVDETPVKMTIAAKIGDSVQVRVGGGSAWLVGNASAPPTDDTRANTAYIVASTAEEESKIAHNAAQSAVASAAEAKATADSVHGIAVQAQTDADQAKASAENASEYAARALGNLASVQSVTETLNWITAHGTMTLTSDVALDPTHVYFVVDPAGDYSVGGNTYSVVTEPDVADIGTYYELSIDESLNNYIATHLAVDGEGLWIIPDTGGNKVLIATGNGTTYTTAGTYIIGKINNADVSLARFTSDEVVIGVDDGTQSYLYLDYHSMQMIDKNGSSYLHVSDLRNKQGYAELIATWTGDGSRTSYEISYWYPDQSVMIYVKVDGVETTDYSINVNRLIFTTAPALDSIIEIKYTSYSSKLKAYTLGTRNTQNNVGYYSFVAGEDCTASNTYSCAIGYQTIASGVESLAEGQICTSTGIASHAEGSESLATGWSAHAEGRQTTASGLAGHAEGEGTKTTARASHAQNFYTEANYYYQTALGKYNDNQSTNAFEIGNGTADDARSNALEVDWNGNVCMALNTTAASGTDHDLYAAITALNWQSEVIV